MKATRIKMKSGCGSSNNVLEIDQIYLEGCSQDGYYTKASVHDYLKKHPNSIYVGISPYPDIQPLVSQNGEKYVRSEPDFTGKDNLLKLPRD